jgi:hypothetical protein
MGPRAGLDGWGKFRSHRSPDYPANIQSLYRLSYPGLHSKECSVFQFRVKQPNNNAYSWRWKTLSSFETSFIVYQFTWHNCNQQQSRCDYFKSRPLHLYIEARCVAAVLLELFGSEEGVTTSRKVGNSLPIEVTLKKCQKTLGSCNTNVRTSCLLLSQQMPGKKLRKTTKTCQDSLFQNETGTPDIPRYDANVLPTLPWFCSWVAGKQNDMK